MSRELEGLTDSLTSYFRPSKRARTTPPGEADYRGNRYDRSFSGARGGYNNERERYDRGYSNDYRAERGDRSNRQDTHRDNNKQMERGGYKKDDKKVSPVPEMDKSGGRKESSGRPSTGEQRSPGQDPDTAAKMVVKKSRGQQSNELKEREREEQGGRDLFDDRVEKIPASPVQELPASSSSSKRRSPLGCIKLVCNEPSEEIGGHKDGANREIVDM